MILGKQGGYPTQERQGVINLLAASQAGNESDESFLKQVLGQILIDRQRPQVFEQELFIFQVQLPNFLLY